MLVEDHILSLDTQSCCIKRLLVVWNYTFWVVWSIRTVMKISSITYVKKICYFWGFFSYFHGQNKCKIRLSENYTEHKSKKTIYFSSKVYFLVRSMLKSRLNFNFSNFNVLWKGLLMQDCLSRLRVEVGEKTNAHWGSYNGNKHSKSFFTVSSGFNAYLEVFSGENKMQS